MSGTTQAIIAVISLVGGIIVLTLGLTVVDAERASAAVAAGTALTTGPVTFALGHRSGSTTTEREIVELAAAQ